MAKQPRNAGKTIVTLKHSEAKRKNIPTAELESVMQAEQQSPLRVAYERRNRDLDPQLVWRGKDEQDWSDLVVPAPPLFIQEKVQPKVLIDDLLRQASAERLAREVMQRAEKGLLGPQIDLFADFNGLPDTDAKTEFYQHDAHWSNRMILGDSLQVMASLAEREGLRGKVQCIYIDPPYGIKFNSNFQWSTTSRDVKDSVDNMTREPEQVKAFRDTWRDGMHSYLTYLRDRLNAARELLTETGSVYVQIGEQNVHLVRAILEEVFGSSNFISQIAYQTTPFATSDTLPSVYDTILWFAKDAAGVKYRQLFKGKDAMPSADRFSTLLAEDGATVRSMTKAEKDIGRLEAGWAAFQPVSLVSPGKASQPQPLPFNGKTYYPAENSHWKTSVPGLLRAAKASRIHATSEGVRFRSRLDDFAISVTHNIWIDTSGGISSRSDEKKYVVQTSPRVIERCILMTTDPGDLVLDPTCGSGTTAYVAEQWGRRWITIDTSRVALALARARIMGARYPYYLLADSREGQLKEAEVTRTEPSTAPVHNTLRQGFVYERVPHITLKSIANNAEIDVIWEKFEKQLSVVRGQVSVAAGQKKTWEEWEIPREADAKWPEEAKQLHAEFWRLRIARQKEIDASIAAKAEFEFLYDKPYVDSRKVRVAGPFTVESLSPHRVLNVGPDDELIDPNEAKTRGAEEADFAQVILENLRTAGVQQAHKEDRINFTTLTPWPGRYICAVGTYEEKERGSSELGMVNSELKKGAEAGSIHHSQFTIPNSAAPRRAGIFIGPEFGTVARQDLVAAAREAGDANFDVVIACAFNYEAHASEFDKLGRVRILKARMNAELHMAGELKNTGKGNLFVIFGEPDIEIIPDDGQIRVKINGVDVFHPQSGEVRSDGAEGIACWFIDTDYNEESFFVRQAYFLGQNDPYKALKTTLKAEINEEAWATLNSDISRPFPKPAGGKIAVKVINHLGDEVMKVFRVESR